MNAALLGVFIVLHLSNHLFLVAGHEAHGAVLSLLRPLYRNPVVEPALLALFTMQIGLGLVLLRRRGWPPNGWGRAQAVSGLTLGLFLLVHVGAVITARPSTDTDTDFAAAVVIEAPSMWLFIPYYIAAIAALATHLAAARRFARWPAAPGLLTRALPVSGIILGIVIVAGLRGAFEPG